MNPSLNIPHRLGGPAYLKRSSTIYNPQDRRYRRSKTTPKIKPDPTVGKTKKRHTLYDRTHEEMTSAEYYETMLLDEKTFPKMRVYSDRIRYLEEAKNIYKFYFKEAYQALEQRKQTCHLAMAYFTQTVMRCPNLKMNELGVIAVAALFCASKFDEIDYHLPPIILMKQLMDHSRYISHYDRTFLEEDIIACEKNICKRLKWNFHQYTPFHFLQVLMDQGIVSSSDLIYKKYDPNRQEPRSGVLARDNKVLANGTKTTRAHQRNRSSSNNLSFDVNTSGYTTNDTYGNSTKRRGRTETTNKFDNSENFDSNTGNNSGIQERKYHIGVEEQLKLAKICEYMLRISSLVFELQNYPASKVAASCILAARKILKIHPIWGEHMENTTKYSYLDLMKCMNLLLENYNNIKIGKDVKSTAEILGKQPQSFTLQNKIDTSFSAEISTNKVKNSISPKKMRHILRQPELGSKAWSDVKEQKKAEIRPVDTSHYNNSPHSGILKRRNKQNSKDIDRENFEISVDPVPPTIDTTFADSATKKVSFANQVSVKHGSKKLIETIEEDNIKDRNVHFKKKYKEDEALPLRKYRSYNGGNIYVGLGEREKLKTMYQTPLDVKGKQGMEPKTNAKPPLPSEPNSGVTTEKREMSPKAWKQNRIRKHNKNGGEINNVCYREPYKSIDKEEKPNKPALFSHYSSNIPKPI